MNILSLFRRRAQPVRRMIQQPAGPVIRQITPATANAQAQSARQPNANAQPGASRPRRDGESHRSGAELDAVAQV